MSYILDVLLVDGLQLVIMDMFHLSKSQVWWINFKHALNCIASYFFNLGRGSHVLSWNPWRFLWWIRRQWWFANIISYRFYSAWKWNFDGCMDWFAWACSMEHFQVGVVKKNNYYIAIATKFCIPKVIKALWVNYWQLCVSLRNRKWMGKCTGRYIHHCFTPLLWRTKHIPITHHAV